MMRNAHRYAAVLEGALEAGSGSQQPRVWIDPITGAMQLP